MITFNKLFEAKDAGGHGSEKHHVMSFARMNPPTTGHMEVVSKLHAVAKEHNAPHSLIVSGSNDAKKNPLTAEQKVKHLKRYSPETNVKAADKESPTILHHAAALHKSGVEHLHVVAGSDRHKEMHDLLHKYNTGEEHKHGSFKFKSITMHSSGERDPDSEGTTGMSGTKMRQHAHDNNFTEFRKGVPSHVSDKHAHELMKDVRQGSGIKEEAISYQTFMEVRMSAAVKLQRAFEREQQKSAASRQRAHELLNPPKPKPSEHMKEEDMQFTESVHDNRTGFAKKKREDDEGGELYRHTYKFNVSKPGVNDGEKHERHVTTPLTPRKKGDIEHLARAHLTKQGYQIHEGVKETPTGRVHTKDDYEGYPSTFKDKEQTKLKNSQDRHRMNRIIPANDKIKEEAGDKRGAYKQKSAVVIAPKDPKAKTYGKIVSKIRTMAEESEEIVENHLMDYRRYTQAAKNARDKGDHDIAKDAEQKATKSAAHYTRVTGKKPTFNEETIDESMTDSWNKVQSMDKGSVTGGKHEVKKHLDYLTAVHAHHKKFGNDTLKVRKKIESIKRSHIAEESDAHAKSEENKRSADAAKSQARPFDYHMHMADHHDNLAQWHSEKGRHGVADTHTQKAEEHHDKAMSLKEDVEQIDEISDDAKSNYIKAVRKSVTHLDNTAYNHRQAGDEKTADKFNAKRDQRSVRANQTYSGMSASAKKKANEEVEQVQEDAKHAQPGWMLRQDPALAKKIKDQLARKKFVAGEPTKKNVKEETQEKLMGLKSFITLVNEGTKQSSGDDSIPSMTNAPVAPTLDRKYIKGTPEHKAYKVTKKPINGMPTGKYNEELEEGLMDTVKKVAKKAAEVLGGPDDEGHKKDLQKKMGVPQTGKVGMAKQNEEVVEEELKGDQHKLDKNKNGKLDKHDFKLLRKEAKDEKEYGYEGDMALNQLATLTRCADMIKDTLKPDTDLPEWVQSKITLATDYIQTAADYLYSEAEVNEETLDEANHREFASQGKMHPDMAKHMKTGQETDFYHSKTGDKISGVVKHTTGGEVHIKAHKDGKMGAGDVHKFKVSSKLDEAAKHVAPTNKKPAIDIDKVNAAGQEPHEETFETHKKVKKESFTASELLQALKEGMWPGTPEYKAKFDGAKQGGGSGIKKGSSYGGSLQKDEPDHDEEPASAGRKVGSKSGARKNLGNSKLHK